MKSHLAILMWAASPDAPERCATPFVHAAVAMAMDVEVEMHFSGKSVLLLVEGVAAGLLAGSGGGMSIYRHLRQATDLGVKLFACSDALAAHVPPGASLITELTGVAGAAAFMARVLDPDWASLVY